MHAKPLLFLGSLTDTHPVADAETLRGRCVAKHSSTASGSGCEYGQHTPGRADLSGPDQYKVSLSRSFVLHPTTAFSSPVSGIMYVFLLLAIDKNSSTVESTVSLLDI